MKLSKYHLTTDLLDDVGLPGSRIIFSTRSAISILVEEKIYQQLQAGAFSVIETDILQTLIENEFIVPDRQDEFNYVFHENQSVKKDGNYLSLTIQPSANCQLGCHYCGQVHTRHQASDDMIEKYYNRAVELLAKKSYQGISITWYGGEPLTGYTALKKASEKFIGLCTERKLQYLSNIVTNGLSLKPALFEELVKTCRVTSYQVTIDGTAESHDKRRITKKGGEGTFDIITKNIIDITRLPVYNEYNCHINIRVNIDKTNCDFVDPLLDFIRDKGLHKKVSVYFAPVVNFGGNDAGKAGLLHQEFAEREINWLLKCYEEDIQVSILPRRQYSACMVEQEDSEVFDAYGNIYACWEFPYSEAYSGGDSLIGNLNFPSHTYNENATLRNWPSVLEAGETWCKTCTHLPICGGSCPKSWYEKTPACPPFKSNYKEKLLLDYYIRKKQEVSAPGVLAV